MKSSLCIQYLYQKIMPLSDLFKKVVGVQKFVQRNLRKRLLCIMTEQSLCCVPASTEASCALALPRDVVAQSAITTVTVLAAVDAILAKRAWLGTNWTLWKTASNEPYEIHQSQLLHAWNTQDNTLTLVFLLLMLFKSYLKHLEVFRTSNSITVKKNPNIIFIGEVQSACWLLTSRP